MDGERLEGSRDEDTKGGLALAGLSDSQKSPRRAVEGKVSQLGLDELAAEKKLATLVSKRPRSIRPRERAEETPSNGFRGLPQTRRPERLAIKRSAKPPRPVGSTAWESRRPGGTPAQQSSWDKDEDGIPSRRSNPWRQTSAGTPGEAPFVRGTPMTSRHPTLDQDDDFAQYEIEQARAERQWYLQDDDNTNLLPDGTADHSHPVVGAPPVRDEEELALKQAKRLSARAASLNQDSNRWEDLQMKLGGGGKQKTENAHMDMDESSGPRIGLLVKDTIPPFLDGRVSHTVQESTVLPIKDPTSDMAVLARKGSALVKIQKESRDKEIGRVKYWELGNKFAGAMAQEDARNTEDRAIAEAERLKERENLDQGKDSKSSMRYATTLGSKRAKVQSNASILNQRESLPVHTVKYELLQVVRDNPVVIIVGETGSGKTTQLTQYILEDFGASNGIVGCTQPRRVAAVSVAQRVAEETHVNLGQEVGYAIRFEDQTSDKTTIKYMTDGILLRETLSDPDLEKYGCVIMDEAHERSLNTDVLFGVLRDVLTRRQDLRVVVTSATLNAQKFSEFFGGAPVFHIPGRTYPVETFFSKTPVEDYVDGAVKQVLQIHLQAPIPGDILVFMTGQEDIETTCEVLAQRVAKLENPPPLLILPIYSQLAADLQAKIFAPAPPDTRKVIVGTNIAETSITIDGVRFVVDSGYCKLKSYNPRLGMDALLLCPTSRASSNQRAGRAGRTGPGRCYRLFTAAAYSNEMLDTSVPEIQRTNLSHVVLLLKSIGVRNLLDFAFMDPPPADNIIKSMHLLWTLGALDGAGDLTSRGKQMASFPLDPPLSAMLLAGDRLGCTAEVVTIVSMLSVPSVFYRPRGREEESDAAREKFFVPESDHLTLLHVFQRWKAAGSRQEWCTKHFINYKGLRRALEVRGQLVEVMKEHGIEVKSCGSDWDVVRKSVCASYFTQAARMKGIGEYINMRTGVVCQIHPTSALYGLGFTQDYVVYHELICTQREYMSGVTAVEPSWLSELGPMFYVLKEGGLSRKEKFRQEREDERKMEEELLRSQEEQAEKSVWGSSLSKLSSARPAERLVTPGRKDHRTPRRQSRFGL